LTRRNEVGWNKLELLEPIKRQLTHLSRKQTSPTNPHTIHIEKKRKIEWVGNVSFWVFIIFHCRRSYSRDSWGCSHCNCHRSHILLLLCFSSLFTTFIANIIAFLGPRIWSTQRYTCLSFSSSPCIILPFTIYHTAQTQFWYTC